LLIFLKRFLAAFFVLLIWKPIYFILRPVFYIIIVKGYSSYLTIIKKLGWSGFRGNLLGFLVNQKLIHIFVVGLTLVFVFANLAGKTKADSAADLANQTILANFVKSEFGTLDEGLIEEYIDEESSISAQPNYLDNLAYLKSQPQAVMTSPDDFEADGEMAAITAEGSAMIKLDIATTKKTKMPRAEIIYYTVNPGDTVSTIAAEFEISVNTILWENNLSIYSLIRPGNKLAILPTSGVTHKVVSGDNVSRIATKYGVEEGKIIEANNLTESGRLSVGQNLIIPGGRKVSAPQPTSSGYTGISVLIDLVKPPAAAPTANTMNWPTEGHRITQYYSWRHSGVDIANKIGTPIYAADAGVVEFVGSSQGYGNNIIIDHGGGKKTRYAHLSKFYVKRGQEVDKGEAIAAMGSTGWSTGSHLHFEVIINGRKYNPLNYIR